MSPQPIRLILSLAVAAVFCGCDKHEHPDETTDLRSGNAQVTYEKDSTHSHTEQGPHGGLLVELGDEAYHAELLHDDAAHAIHVYILDGAGEQDVAIDAPEITLQVFQDGKFVDHLLKPVDDKLPASEYAFIDEQLAHQVHDTALRGRLHVTIDGQSYTGTVATDAHHAEDHAEDEHVDENQQEEAQRRPPSPTLSSYAWERSIVQEFARGSLSRSGGRARKPLPGR